jgi:hypothetical protein
VVAERLVYGLRDPDYLGRRRELYTVERMAERIDVVYQPC